MLGQKVEVRGCGQEMQTKGMHLVTYNLLVLRHLIASSLHSQGYIVLLLLES